MPQYRFPIVDRNDTIPDEDGVELPDDAAAIAEARRAAADMLRDAARSGDEIGHQVIQIWDGVRLVSHVRLQPVEVLKPN